VNFLSTLLAEPALAIIADLLQPRPRQPRPNLQAVQPPSVQQGTPIAVGYGTFRISPTITWWGNPRAVASAKFPGSYNYGFDMQAVFCAGPVQKILDFIANDYSLVQYLQKRYYLNSTGGINKGPALVKQVGAQFPLINTPFAPFYQMQIDAPNLFGGPQSQGGLSLVLLDFFLGGNLQQASGALGQLIGNVQAGVIQGGPFVAQPNYPALCYMVAYRFATNTSSGYYGTSPVPPNFSAVIQSCPDTLSTSLGHPEYAVLSQYDANPVEVIYDILTSGKFMAQLGAGIGPMLQIPASAIDLASFTAACQQVYTEALIGSNPGPPIPQTNLTGIANTGLASFTNVSGTLAGVVETITVRMTSATTFTVTGTVSGAIGTGTVGTPFTSSVINFTLTQLGTTAFASGDYWQFNITLIASAGISFATNNDATAAEALLRDIVSIIDGVLFPHPETGLITLALCRGGYVLSSQLLCSEDSSTGVPANIWDLDYSCTSWPDSYNKVWCRYLNRGPDNTGLVTAVGNAWTESQAIADLPNIAALQANGGIGQLADPIDFPMIKNGLAAAVICQRALRIVSVPRAKAQWKQNRTAHSVVPGQVVQLKSSRYGLTTPVAMRITSVDPGTLESGVITVRAQGDVYLTEAAQFPISFPVIPGLPPLSPGGSSAGGTDVVTVTPAAATIQVGQTQLFTAATTADGVAVPDTYVWSSSDTPVASIAAGSSAPTGLEIGTSLNVAYDSAQPDYAQTIAFIPNGTAGIPVAENETEAHLFPSAVSPYTSPPDITIDTTILDFVFQTARAKGTGAKLYLFEGANGTLSGGGVVSTSPAWYATAMPSGTSSATATAIMYALIDKVMSYVLATYPDVPLLNVNVANEAFTNGGRNVNPWQQYIGDGWILLAMQRVRTHTTTAALSINNDHTEDDSNTTLRGDIGTFWGTVQAAGLTNLINDNEFHITAADSTSIAGKLALKIQTIFGTGTNWIAWSNGLYSSYGVRTGLSEPDVSDYTHDAPGPNNSAAVLAARDQDVKDATMLVVNAALSLTPGALAEIIPWQPWDGNSWLQAFLTPRQDGQPFRPCVLGTVGGVHYQKKICTDGTNLYDAFQAAVTAGGADGGLALGLSPGLTTITATDPDGNSGTALLTVVAATAPAITTLFITPATATIPVGATQQFTASADDQFSAPIADTFTYTSANPAIATVNSSTGLATAVSAGSTQIIATDTGGRKIAANLTVVAAPPPPAGEQLVLATGEYVSAVIPALAAGGGTAGSAMRFLVDPLLGPNGTVGGITSLQVTGGGGVYDVWWTVVGTSVQFRISIMGGTANQITFTIPQASLPAAGTPVILFVAYDPGGGAGSGVILLTSDGPSPTIYGSNNALGAGTAALPAGTYTYYVGYSTQVGTSSAYGGITVDGTWLDPDDAAWAQFYDVPLQPLAGRFGLWTFDAGTLAELNGGPSLVATGGTPTYVAGGIWGSAAGAGPPATIVITPSSATALNAQAVDLSAQAYDSTGAPVSDTITWSSSNPALVSVNPTTGVATANAGTATGTAIITATDGTISATARITVSFTVPVIKTLTVTPAAASAAPGQTVQYTAHPEDQNGNPIADTVTFAIGPAGVASVTPSGGLATAIAAGSALLTVSDASGHVATATLAVVAAPPPSGIQPSGLTTWVDTGKITEGVVNGGTSLFTNGSVSSSWARVAGSGSIQLSSGASVEPQISGVRFNFPAGQTNDAAYDMFTTVNKGTGWLYVRYKIRLGSTWTLAGMNANFLKLFAPKDANGNDTILMGYFTGWSGWATGQYVGGVGEQGPLTYNLPNLGGTVTAGIFAPGTQHTFEHLFQPDSSPGTGDAVITLAMDGVTYATKTGTSIVGAGQVGGLTTMHIYAARAQYSGVQTTTEFFDLDEIFIAGR
jgi:uncharacterized protein YjdB